MQVTKVPVDENPRGLFLCARFVVLVESIGESIAESIGETAIARLIVCSLMARTHPTGAS
jgi:hypothetical protein